MITTQNTPNPFQADRAKAFEAILAEADHPEKVTKTACLELFRAVKKAARYAELFASDEAFANDPRSTKLDERNDARIVHIAQRMGIKVTIGGDPRGHVVHLMTPKTGRYNTWGGAECGWGLHT